MLIAPTEPLALRALGTTSSTSEILGADYILDCPHAIVAIQRKEWHDLLASRADGRLSREIGLLQSADRRILLVEGYPQWTSEGRLMDPRVRWDQEGWWGLQLSALVEHGVWTIQTADRQETSRRILHANRWFSKSDHRGLLNMGGATGGGTKRAYQLAVLCSFPGVGIKTAAAILEVCGKVPLELDRGDSALLGVPGLGKGRLEQIKEILA